MTDRIRTIEFNITFDITERHTFAEDTIDIEAAIDRYKKQLAESLIGVNWSFGSGDYPSDKESLADGPDDASKDVSIVKNPEYGDVEIDFTISRVDIPVSYRYKEF